VKTLGIARLDPNSRQWIVKAEPHILLRLKRVFERVAKSSHGHITLSDTPENARELEWFAQRFPLEIEPRDHLEARAEEHRRREASIAEVLSGEYSPPTVALALPPRPYQVIAAELCRRSGSLLLADDVGLGKTISAITLLANPDALPALVVTLTHLPPQWTAELKKFAPALRVQTLKEAKPYDLLNGRGRGRDGRFPDVIIANYHKLSGWADTLAGKVRTIVFDEVQELRHEGTNRYIAAEHLAGQARYRLGLSATPIYNFGGELFNVINVLSPGALGSRGEFGREWCGGDVESVREPKALGTYLRGQGVMLRRTRAEVGRELPPVSTIPQIIDADPKALDAVGERTAELARIILAQGGQQRGEKLRASQEISFLLRQATGIAKAPFVAEFVRLLVESGEKVVLYGWHHEVYAIWRDRLADLKPAFYTGAESEPQKLESKRRFVAGETPVLILSLRAGAGLDGLQHVSRTVVFGELDWSPGVHEQATGRVARDGQTDPVCAYFLVAESGSDPVVADVLGLKRAESEAIRDPNASLLEDLQVSPDHIRRLAEAYLSQRTARPTSEAA
jgi:SNF2 family DNA or RNA helicase